MSQSERPEPDDDELADRARRRLLRLSVYVPPALLGLTFATSARAQNPQPQPSVVGNSSIRSASQSNVEASIQASSDASIQASAAAQPSVGGGGGPGGPP